MNRYLIVGAAVAAVVAAGYFSSPSAAPAPVAPAPQPCPGPGPCPTPPKPKPKPWGACVSTAGLAGLGWREGGVLTPGSLGASVSGPVAPDGTEIHCDYPGERHVKNTSSHGLGLCVFTSIHHAADWQNIPQLIDMPKWMIKSSIPGGGYPEKVKTLITRISKERGMPEPDYVQVEGPASQVFPVLAEATKSGRMVCITYSRSPTGRYGGSSISHMVNLPHLDQANAAVLDNNYVGYDKFEWMTPAELEKAAGGSRIWAIIFASPGPPPAPHNADTTPVRRPQAIRDGVHQRPPQERAEKTCDCSPECTCGCNDGKPCRCGNPAVRPDREARCFGVEWDKLAPEVRFHHKGYEVTLDDFLAAIPDDSKKYRAVVVGPKEKVAQVEADWKAFPQDVKDAYVLQAYEPTHWHVKDMGFALDKSPAIHILKPDGTLVEYQEGYDQAKFVAALRRKSPDFKPQPAPAVPGLPSNLPIVPAAVVGGIGVVAYLVLRRKK